MSMQPGKPPLLHYDASLAQRSASTSGWEILIDETLRRRALKAALFIAGRMREPLFVDALAKQTVPSISSKGRWTSASISGGLAGIALMYGYFARCFPGQGWDLTAQRYMKMIAEDTQQIGLTLMGAFSGTASMATVLESLSQGGRRYKKALSLTQQALFEQIKEHTWIRSPAEEGIDFADYDVLAGAAGLLASLVSTEKQTEPRLAAIETLLEYLVWLAEPDQRLGGERWYVPPHFATDAQRDLFPEGFFDCGLSHGVPGILAALSLAWLAGYRYPGLREAMDALAGWIVEHSIHDQWGISWPTRIPQQVACFKEAWSTLPPARTAWCYGGPGVARSLWLAGNALDNPALCHLAITAIESALRRPTRLRYIDAPMLCHGISGLLQICMHFAHEGESTLAREHVSLLLEDLLQGFQPDYAFGFRYLETNNLLIDWPGWLTGAAGIALVLLAVSTPIAPAWDRLLCIA
ncbi:lanthionine synthetase C family protein [Ktedonosporobacter rubrisoli]|nr:lanthionine synthetase C family protein [Ktedonosporobacter rubrisoli]